jgi:hypothetical protein
MIDFAEKYKGGEYSQNGEAGIIDECIRRIGFISGTAVEYGAPTKQYCSNIFHLIEKGWRCIYFDTDPKEDGIVTMEITEENVNDLPNCTIISMDTDGLDYALWAAYNKKPDIVIIEINSSLPPMKGFYLKERGASYLTMLKLGIAKGYFLLCHTGNLIFLLDKYRKLFPEVEGNGIDNYQLYFNTSWQ